MNGSKRASAKVQPEKQMDYRLEGDEVADFDNVAYRGTAGMDKIRGAKTGKGDHIG